MLWIEYAQFYPPRSLTIHGFIHIGNAPSKPREITLGRITKDSMRGRLQANMIRLRTKYREALKDDDMQEAFDIVWGDWNNEQAAMIYAGEISALDLLNLTGVLANRRDLQSLQRRVEDLEKTR